MLFDIDLDISKKELAQKLGISEDCIGERGVDFEALYFDETDFDTNSDEDYDNVPTHMKMFVIGEAIHSNRAIEELINSEINEQIYSSEKMLRKLQENN